MKEKIKWAYSINEESYYGPYNNREEAIEAGKVESKNAQLTAFQIGKINYPNVVDHIDTDDILERIEESLYDNELSFVVDGDILEVSDRKDFDNAIKEVIKEYCSTIYWTAYDIEEIASNK